jgi:AcrR family transcriptional regulator
MAAERYGSKEAVLDALMNQYEGRIVIDVDPEATGFEKAMAPLDAMVRFEREDPTFLRAMYVISFEAVHDEGALRDRIREWLMRFRQALKTGIDEGQQDGSVSAQVEADDLSREILTSGGRLRLLVGRRSVRHRFLRNAGPLARAHREVPPTN